MRREELTDGKTNDREEIEREEIEESLRKYQQDLQKTLLFGELVSCLAFIAGYSMILNLIKFTTQGTSFIHPLLSLFILAASVLIFLVTSNSMLQTSHLIMKEDPELRRRELEKRESEKQKSESPP